MAEITADVIIDKKESKIKNGLNKAGTWIKNHKAIVAGVAIAAVVTTVALVFGDDLVLFDGTDEAPFESDDA